MLDMDIRTFMLKRVNEPFGFFLNWFALRTELFNFTASYEVINDSIGSPHDVCSFADDKSPGWEAGDDTIDNRSLIGDIYIYIYG